MPGQDVTPQTPDRTEDEDREAASIYKASVTQTNELEFMESLSESGTHIYEKVLDLGKQRDMLIIWGKKGFSLNVKSKGKNIVICFGYPPTTNNQALYTWFRAVENKSNVQEDVIETLRKEALATNLFVPVGVNNDLKCETDRELDDSQVSAITNWLTKVINTIRESEATDKQVETDRPAVG